MNRKQIQYHNGELMHFAFPLEGDFFFFILLEFPYLFFPFPFFGFHLFLRNQDKTYLVDTKEMMDQRLLNVENALLCAWSLPIYLFYLLEDFYDI